MGLSFWFMFWTLFKTIQKLFHWHSQRFLLLLKEHLKKTFDCSVFVLLEAEAEKEDNEEELESDSQRCCFF
jgi:hypothetical protein